jgi:hypothetical protein
MTATGGGGTGSYTYLWYKNGITTGVTTHTYDPGVLTATTTFYCAITSGICGPVNSNTITITVYANLTSSISGGTTPICYNTDPGTMTATGGGGTGSYTYLWYKNGITTGVTTQTYDPGVLTATTTFYCAITSGSCGTVNSNTITITVYANLTASISGGTTPICYNTDPGTMTATGGGGTGSFTYLWYTNGVSTGVTTHTYDPGVLTATTTFYCAITSGICGPVNSNTITITVYANLTSSISGGTTPICYNTDPGTMTATGGGGTGSYTYLWYKNGITTGVTTHTYDPGVLTSTTTFYCAITSGSCGTVNSNTITITVYANLTASISGGTTPICYNTDPGTMTATGGGGTGSYTYLWYKNGITTGITTHTYDPGVLTATTTFYCAITSGSCGTVNSNTITITVNPLPTPTITGSTSVCVTSTGNVYTTQAGMTNYVWTVVGGAITAGGTPTNNTVTVTWTSVGTESVSVNYTNGNGCTATSATVYNVTVHPLPTPTITANYCARPGYILLTANPTTGVTYLWSDGRTNDTTYVNVAGMDSVVVTNTYGCSATALLPVGVELVVNGDFSAGNTGFISSYNYVDTYYIPGNPNSGLWPEDTYAVDWDPHYLPHYHPNFWGKDHTTGSGNFMAVNGSNPPVSVWQETVTVIPNTNYYFSAWAISLNSVSPFAQLQFNVNGSQIGTTAVLQAQPEDSTSGYHWTQFYGNWTSPSGVTTAVIQIVDLQTAAGGNDFGLDDISFGSVYPIPPMPVLAANGGGPVCVGGTLNLTCTLTNGIPPYTFSWTGPNGFTSNLQNPGISNITMANAGRYYLSVLDVGYGCPNPDTTSLVVIVNPLPVPTITGPASVCINSTGNVYTTEASMTNYVWAVSAGGTITAGGTATNNTVTVTWNTAGARTVSVNYTNANGCTAASPAVLNVTVAPINTAGSPSSNPTLCINTVLTPNITIATTGATGIGSATGLPAGVTAAWASNTITISGTPAASGTFNYSIPLTGGCGSVNATGTIIVTPNNTAGSPSSNPTLCINTVLTPNITIATTGATGIGSATGLPAGVTAAWASNIITISGTPAASGTFNYSIPLTGGCGSVNATGTITVNPLPIPSITGPASVCVNSTGNVYTTQGSMTNYVWSVSAGGVVTAGGGPSNNTVIVTWNTAGSQTVSVNYTNVNGCTAASPTVYNVTVNPLPVPTISGAASVCQNSSGNVYTTQASMTNYVWAVAGGTITAGGTATDNTVTVTWTTLGTESVSVNYHNANGCTAASPTVYNVTVNALPAPTISGSASVCQNSTGNVYTTQGSMTNYVWAVAGGTITAGGTATDNTVTVTWTTLGTESVSVNYHNANGCTAASPTVYNVTVNALPVPTISGSASVCQNSTGNVYTTQTGMTNYVWTVSAGGSISAGGGPSNNTVIVTWNTAGSQTVSVNYTNANGCTAASPTVFNVTVNTLPVPTISGPASACVNSAGNVYTTQGSMTNYIWAVSAGGMITSGGGAANNTVTVTWNTAGSQTVSVNYTNGNSCTAPSPTVYAVTVNPLPVPTITGPASACVNSIGNVYTTQGSMSNYVWAVSSGGMITAGGGAGNSTVTVTWNTTGSQTVSVNYTDGNGCTAAIPTVYAVTVNSLPVPTITGPASVCLNSTGNVYTTQGSMSNYVWVVSAGGTISAGGGPSNSAVIVTWTTAGSQTVSVNYTNGNGCTSSSPSVYEITVNPLPVPTITGPASVCVNSAGNVYSTQGSMTNYIWAVSGGGTITAGGGAGNNTVTVTWNTTGPQTVSVNYTNGNSCTATSPTVFNVTVNALPAPTILGSASVCQNSTGNVYTTQIGMTNYVWAISAGGTITAGGTATDNTVTVTWNTTGSQTVSVNYTNGNSCTATNPTVYSVTVNALPVPTISGPASACVNSTGNTYTTESNMTNYLWVVSAGGSISAGGGPSNPTVVVTWNTAGAQTVSVNYTNGNGCTASNPTVYNVTVNALPVPTITGPASACVNSAGNVYTTQGSMSNYVWAVSAGGTITAGGGPGNNSVIITWTTAGAQTVSVNYTNGNGCTASSPTVYNVTVNALPVPTITGPASACVNSAGNVYTTQGSMSNYVWAVSAGGTITAGGGPGNNSVIVTWATAGAQTVSVNYTNGNGCTASSPTVYNVTVHALPVPTITGPASVCVNSAGNVYTTQGSMSNYVWAVSAGGTITAGGGPGNNTVIVTWTTAGAQTVSVNYTNGNGCTASSPTVYNVTVNALPVPTITGPASVCVNTAGNVYTTQGSMSNYVWAVSAGGTITAGGGPGNNTVIVTWTTAGAQTVSVNYTNGNGCTASSPTVYNVTVNALPVPTITGPASVCVNSAGNVYTTQGSMSNYVWAVSAGGTITAGGGPGNNTVIVTWNTAGAQTVSVNYTNVNGCTAATPTIFNVMVTPNNTILLSSAVGTNNQTVCINSAITNITYATTGATGATFTGLPTGVTGVWASNTVTISGTPSVSGTFNYTVTLTGGCGNVAATGTITVNPRPITSPIYHY